MQEETVASLLRLSADRTRRQEPAGARGSPAAAWPERQKSDLRIEIEKRVQAALELRLDLFPGALDHMHGHVRLVAVGKFQGRVLDFGYFAFRQQSQSVDQSQVGHNRYHRDLRDNLAGASSKGECA